MNHYDFDLTEIEWREVHFAEIPYNSTLIRRTMPSRTVILDEDVHLWLYNQFGRPATSLNRLSQADCPERWFFSNHSTVKPGGHSSTFAVFFADRAHAMLFKLAWL